MQETNIILAVIGCVGLLSTLAVYSRANRAVTKYEQLLKKWWLNNYNVLVSGCYTMQSKHGCITMRVQVHLLSHSINNCVMSYMMRTCWLYARTHQSLHLSPLHPHANVHAMLHNHRLREYEVTLRSGVWYLLAPDSEEAAWSSLELSRERNDQLLNVRQTDEW
jgi:predicted MPP superfamily phosphohydrolase